MLKNPRFIILTCLIIGISVFFFLQNDEAYLKKTTLKLLKLASVSKQETNPIVLLKRVEKIAKHIHFDVQFKLKANGRVWEDHSAGEFRTLLLTYFKMGGLAEISGTDLSVQIDPETLNGHVRFKLHGQRGEDAVSCDAHFIWIKEKKWFIKNLEVFSCSPITF